MAQLIDSELEKSQEPVFKPNLPVSVQEYANSAGSQHKQVKAALN